MHSSVGRRVALAVITLLVTASVAGLSSSPAHAATHSAPPGGKSGTEGWGRSSTRAASARKALTAAASGSGTRSFQSTNSPSPCYYSVWSDPQDASELDGTTYAAQYDCPSNTWKFSVATRDSWSSDKLDFYAIAIDGDNNPSTGCNGFEWQADGFWDPGTQQLLAGMFQTPTCDIFTETQTIGISRAGNTGVVLTFSNTVIGNPDAIIWYSGLKSVNLTDPDELPDANPPPGLHREDGFKPNSTCTGEVFSTGGQPHSYAVVDDVGAATTALRAANQPGVDDSGTTSHVVRFAGDPVAGAEAMARRGIKATVTADQVRRYAATPNDALYGQQWSLPAVKAPAAWDVTTGSPSIVVADLDSGVDATHSELSGKLVQGYDATTGQLMNMSTNSDTVGHGTATAGVIGAATDNSTQVASLGWQTKVMPVKIGDEFVLASDEVEGLNWAVQHGARIANLSVGSECTDANEKTAIQSAQANGVLVVASAGNYRQQGNRPEYPAALPGVLSVGATGFDGAVTTYSNTGAYVDMVAPGGSADGNSTHDILVLAPGNMTRTAAGTSFSAPLVSAAAALVLAANPALTGGSARNLLINTATDMAPTGFDFNSGAGMLNAALATQTAALRTKYNPLAPARILDTRDGTGGVGGALGQSQTKMVTVTGVGNVPASGVSAVALNVTATGPTVSSFLTVYPSDGARPLASNLNFDPGQTIPNMVVVRVGADGKVGLFNNAGTVDVIFDVVGWYGSTGDSYNALPPQRILDTRTGAGDTGGAFQTGEQRSEQVLNVGGVPASGVTAVILNVTVTEPTGASYLTVFPSGTGAPNASNLNFTPGLTIPNLVVARVGNDGKVAVFNNAGNVHVIFDVVGWYGSSGQSYAPIPPSRVLDTRNATGDPSGAFGGGTQRNEQIAGVGGVPSTGVSAVVLNVTVTGPTAASYLTLFPSGGSPPNASNLNFTAGQTIPNLVVVRVGPDGKVGVFNNAGNVHVIFDVVGWFTGP